MSDKVASKYDDEKKKVDKVMKKNEEAKELPRKQKVTDEVKELPKDEDNIFFTINNYP